MQNCQNIVSCKAADLGPSLRATFHSTPNDVVFEGGFQNWRQQTTENWKANWRQGTWDRELGTENWKQNWGRELARRELEAANWGGNLGQELKQQTGQGTGQRTWAGNWEQQTGDRLGTGNWGQGVVEQDLHSGSDLQACDVQRGTSRRNLSGKMETTWSAPRRGRVLSKCMLSQSPRCSRHLWFVATSHFLISPGKRGTWPSHQHHPCLPFEHARNAKALQVPLLSSNMRFCPTNCGPALCLSALQSIIKALTPRLGTVAMDKGRNFQPAGWATSPWRRDHA